MFFHHNAAFYRAIEISSWGNWHSRLVRIQVQVQVQSLLFFNEHTWEKKTSKILFSSQALPLEMGDLKKGIPSLRCWKRKIEKRERYIPARIIQYDSMKNEPCTIFYDANTYIWLWSESVAWRFCLKPPQRARKEVKAGFRKRWHNDIDHFHLGNSQKCCSSFKQTLLHIPWWPFLSPFVPFWCKTKMTR